MRTNDRSNLILKKLLLYLELILFSLSGFYACANEQGPPDAVIDEAKQRTLAIIDSMRALHEEEQMTPELLDEYYDQEEKRYVLEYHIETGFGSALTDTPTAYLTKENGRWKYNLTYGVAHEFYLGEK